MSIRAVRLRRWSVVPIVAAMLLTVLPGAATTAPDSRSTDFWVAFTENVDASGTLTLFLTSEEPASGTVSIPGLSFSTPFTATPGAVTTVPLPSSARVTGLDVIQDRGVRVQANRDVTVYGLNRLAASTDAFLALPTDVLGTDHLVLAYGNTGPIRQSQFAVVATRPGTTVTITPAADGPAGPRGTPYTLTLDEGQVYQGGTDLAGADITGTSITSNHPVAVFGGHRCANVPAVSFCDHLVEQLPPTSAWGERFVTAPLKTRLRGDTFRILAAEDATEVSVNGVPVATLGRGQHVEQLIEGVATIEATNPVLVAQYSNGARFDDVTSADPFMMLIPPHEQFLAAYTVSTPATGFSGNYINVVAPDAAVGDITRNGVAIPSSAFTPIGTSGFSAAQLTVPAGTHRLIGTLPFGAFVYGYDMNDSYGYPGGASFAPIAVAADLGLTPSTASRMVGDEHCVTATVTDQDGAPLEGVRIDFTVTGPNAGMAFAASDAAGQASSCYTGTASGTDMITASVGSLSATASAEWSSDAPPSVDAGPDVTGVEGSAIPLAGSVADDHGASASWVFQSLTADPAASCTAADAAAASTTVTCTDDGEYRAVLTGDDGVNSIVEDTATITVSNAAPGSTLLSPAAGGEFVRGADVPLQVTFADAGANDTHSCAIAWGDGSSDVGAVDQAARSCTGSHPYATAGAHTVSVTVTDDDGGSSSQSATIVVGEPDGKVTGGGHLVDGDGERLSFGVNASSTAGVGRGQLQVRAGDDAFHGDTVENVVRFDRTARWDGTGRWNGAAGHRYEVRVADAAPDTFAVTIRDGDGTVVYSGSGALQGGQITIHR